MSNIWKRVSDNLSSMLLQTQVAQCRKHNKIRICLSIRTKTVMLRWLTYLNQLSLMGT